MGSWVTPKDQLDGLARGGGSMAKGPESLSPNPPGDLGSPATSEFSKQLRKLDRGTGISSFMVSLSQRKEPKESLVPAL